MKTLAITKYLFTLIGAALLASAFSLYNGTTSFLKEAVSTEGTVVELVPSRSSNSTTYAPVVQFNEINGRLVEFTSNASSNPPAYNRGERVVVLYSPNAPESAKIDGFSRFGEARLLLAFSAWYSARLAVACWLTACRRSAQNLA
ncbi:MAG: DUF3592 domain-containing protein [Marinobacter sp.]|nr:DUF3592 domain-containing protein [Marinobacter sp.]